MEQVKLLKSVDVVKCKLVRDSSIIYCPVNYIQDAVDVLRQFGLGDASDEIFAMLCLDTKLNIVGVHEVAHGTDDQATFKTSDVFKRALLNNANRIIVAHNHPSGDITPSRADDATTTKLVKAGKMLDIPVVDHIIISGNGYYSYASNGRI